MKKKVLIVSFIFSFVSIAVFVGCSKSGSSSNPGTPNADSINITSSAWKFNASGFNLSGGGTVTIPDSTVTACQKDNTYTFHADSTGTMDEGATKCKVGDPQTDPFSWYFKTVGSQKLLHITSNTILNGDLNIFTLNTTNLVVYKDTSLLNVPIRYVVVFNH
jgi:hypothetical protein